GTEKQSIHRKQQCGSLPWDLHMDLRVRATEQRASGIVHLNFDQQGPGRQVNDLGCAHQLSLKLASRKLSQAKVGCHTDFDPLRIFLRDVYVNPQFAGLRDVKEIGFRSATATRINKVPNIGVSRCDDSIERSVNLLERL